jgi:hypothetical protein
MRLMLLICATVTLWSGSGRAQSSVLPEEPDHSQAQLNPFPFEDRMKWAAVTAVSPKRLAGYVVSSAIATATNDPPEYGPHWEGYGKRIGLRLSTGATGLFMEAAVGSLWDEDPRYHRTQGLGMKARLWNIAKMSVMTQNEEGKVVPAYARYISVPANSYLSNLWRPDSRATVDRGARRIPLSFMDRMIANAFTEFLPDMLKMFRKDSSAAH